MSKSETKQDLAAVAAACVEAVDKLPLGEAFADPEKAARNAIEALRAEALPHIFPAAVSPIGADTLSDWSALTEGASRLAYGPALAALHASAMVGHPKLAEALRGPLALARVRRWAEQGATPASERERFADAAARAAALAEHEYLALIAAQLHAAGQCEPHAGTLVAVAALMRRLDTHVEKLRAHAEAEAQRVAREAAEAERAQAEAQRESLVEWFGNQRQTAFVEGDTATPAVTGASVAALLRQGDMTPARALALRDAYVTRLRASLAAVESH